MQIIRAQDCPLVPWKNGGGVTREIATYHDKTRHSDFLWRLSMAIIDRPCAFSRFPEIDRTIVVLDGKGFTLKNCVEEKTHVITDVPFTFAGEQAFEATPLEGATTDLNIMMRRGYFRHQMEKISLKNQAHFTCVGEITFVICNSEMVTVAGQKASRFDSLTGFEKGAVIELTAADWAEIFIINLFAC